MDHSLAEIRARTRLLGEGERLLYSLSAREVARIPALTCGESATLQLAAQLMRLGGRHVDLCCGRPIPPAR